MLHKIYRKYNKLCDKGAAHSYIDFYEGLFASLRKKKLNLLEIGVETGESFRMWSDYFKNASLYGVDIDLSQVQGIAKEISTLVEADSTDPSVLNNFNKNLRFEIIIDDGAHECSSQRKTLDNFLPRLKSKGVYIIEDVPSLWCAEKLVERFKKEKGQVSIIDFLDRKNRYDDLLVIFWKG